jgi:ATP-dependent Clp protease protease subunit
MRKYKYMASTKQLDTTKLSRVITLGYIDEESVNEVIQLIYDINEEDIKKTQVEPIKLIINSPGGEVYSGLALIDVIDNSQTPIYTICHGAAMSMALIVYAAGHHRLASKYATFMYHEANYGLEGKVAVHKQEIKEADRTEKICDDYLLSKTKFTKKQFDSIRKAQGEWYFDVEVAKKHGLVDEIL